VEETLEFIHEHIPEKHAVFMASGIRVYPETPMETLAREAGLIRSRRDLLRPVFYFSPEISRDWLSQRLSRAAREDPRIIRSGQTQQAFLPLAQRVLSWTGVRRPYWRFLPWINKMVARCAG
jgi:hypothetical protein